MAIGSFSFGNNDYSVEKKVKSDIEKVNEFGENLKQDVENSINKVNDDLISLIPDEEIEAFYDAKARVSEDVQNVIDNLSSNVGLIDNTSEKVVSESGNVVTDYASDEDKTVEVDTSSSDESSSAEAAKESVLESDSNVATKAMDVPSGDTSFKSYTNYKQVTNKSTTAYAINNGFAMPYGPYKGQTFEVKTDDTGMRYVDKGDGKKYYTVAMGTYYGTEGDTFNIVTDEGNSFDVIIVDAKGNDTGTQHDGGTWYHTHGSSKDIVEFYISSPNSIRCSGGTYGNYNYDSRFKGNIIKVSKYE